LAAAAGLRAPSAAGRADLDRLIAAYPDHAIAGE
ncbi:phage tail assembly chaperone, partial [Methylobacterium sp. WL9]